MILLQFGDGTLCCVLFWYTWHHHCLNGKCEKVQTWYYKYTHFWDMFQQHIRNVTDRNARWFYFAPQVFFCFFIVEHEILGLPDGAVLQRQLCHQRLLVRAQAVATGRDRENRGAMHNWPSVVREGLAGRDILVSLRTSASCGRPGAVHANQGCQVHGVSPDTLVRLASGLDAHCVKKQCGLVGLCIGGHMTFNLRLSRARTGVVAMRQDNSY